MHLVGMGVAFQHRGQVTNYNETAAQFAKQRATPRSMKPTLARGPGRLSMKRTRHRPEQIIKKLREAEAPFVPLRSCELALVVPHPQP